MEGEGEEGSVAVEEAGVEEDSEVVVVEDLGEEGEVPEAEALEEGGEVREVVGSEEEEAVDAEVDSGVGEELVEEQELTRSLMLERCSNGYTRVYQAQKSGVN